MDFMGPGKISLWAENNLDMGEHEAVRFQAWLNLKDFSVAEMHEQRDEGDVDEDIARLIMVFRNSDTIK